MDFPCSVHKGNYEVSKIAVDANELKEFKADGWMTSAEWYGEISEPLDMPKHRGRRPKTDDTTY